MTIEKIIDNYENEYLRVIKYKGNCPVEDCGGIWGYYQKLETIENSANLEYEDMLWWMKAQGYPKEYDMESVNQKLKKVCFYKWGK